MYSACFFVFCHVYQDTLRGFEQNKKGNNLSFSNYVKLYETIGKVHSSEGQNFGYEWNTESELNRILSVLIICHQAERRRLQAEAAERRRVEGESR